METARDQFLCCTSKTSRSAARSKLPGPSSRVDKMITDAKPWDLAKDENQRHTLGAVLYRAAETLRWLSVLLYPVMPDATRAIAKQLGVTGTSRQDRSGPR